MILWFIGSDLELLWGRRRYSQFLMSSILGGGIIYLLLQTLIFDSSASMSMSLSGFGGAANAMLLAFAIIYPDKILILLFFPVKAKYFCAILIAMQLYTGFFSPMAVLSWGHLGTMLSGFLFMIVVSSPRFKQIFSKTKNQKSFLKSKRFPSKGRANLKLVKGDEEDDNGPKYH